MKNFTVLLMIFVFPFSLLFTAEDLGAATSGTADRYAAARTTRRIGSPA